MWRIGQVINLRAELDSFLLADLEALEDREVVIDQLRTAQRVAARRTVTRRCARRNRISEGRRVEPDRVWADVAGDRRISQLVGPLRIIWPAICLRPTDYWSQGRNSPVRPAIAM